MANKVLAILNSKAPYSSTFGKDSLDIALIFGSYEQGVSLFFQGEGVFQLIPNQDGQQLSMKDYLKTFSAFEFYDIEDIYVCLESLQERKLSNAFHIEKVNILPAKEFAAKLKQHDCILRF
ncbi:sulfurtransferase complex subunit TusC [Colwellia sp. RSH04]|uniref:sulfurtransferase complex subunit TusC n=1 Tax=Colwellia sp. RSH04 TaxID=2305464 RepID=UPI000E57CCCF|nr:sulfurtransferase complex subunit TusC [Colwellia sp. RSH04]RHW77117.1 sulfurtransferase complex subunit TusC [Colwellia sp. RSH04]